VAPLDPAAFAADLLRWYDAAAADLPWRRTSDPYRIWLSEIMLQQTQVTTVVPYFERFVTRFPTVAALAAAPLDDVLKAWEGLGYYARARNLHRAAGQVVSEHGGRFPQTTAALQTLPGIGRYTAGAIASIGFGERVPVLDGNVMRVFSRLTNLSDDIARPATQAHLWALAERLVPANRPGDYNQALMENGRTICRPRAPLCLVCPLTAHCAAFAAGTQDQRPVKAKKAATPHYDVAAGVIWDGQGRLLIAQRKADGLLGGLWEFPGGKLEVDETLPECLTRELREELDIAVTVGDLLTSVKHAFTHFKITLHAFECRHTDGVPQAIGCAAWRWVHPADLDQFAFGRADQQVIAVLRAKERP
jgi:A/G-specific adenine glycosylase